MGDWADEIAQQIFYTNGYYQDKVRAIVAALRAERERGERVERTAAAYIKARDDYRAHSGAWEWDRVVETRGEYERAIRAGRG